MSDEKNQALLGFALGPVQPFIEKARTIRDLWTGSYLISWLTAAAMWKLAKSLGAEPKDIIVSPAVENNLLIQALRGQLQDKKEKLAATTPCSPHRFVALVPADRAAEVQEYCRQGCLDEWDEICDAVHQKLDDFLRPLHPDWDRNWDAQVNSCFTVSTAVLRPDDNIDELNKQLKLNTPEAGWKPMDLLGAIMEAMKSVRKPPAYKPQDEDGLYPPKCSLFGSYEQMGPAKLTDSDSFWEKIGEKKNWKGFGGSRLGKRDRFCAISLVKRFAWPLYFATEKKLDLNPRELRSADSATVAARQWLQAEPKLNLANVWNTESKYWNGQWLHWKDQHQDPEEERCPDDVWKQIQQKRQQQKSPPTYYAVLMMDGDQMGKLFRGEIGSVEVWGKGQERIQSLSKKLSKFAMTRVEEIVKEHHGELVYSGGDDIRALIPTRTVLKCADELRKEFGDAIKGQTMSAGIAVVHMKEDLRFAHRQAQRAEKLSKDAGRDAVTLTVCRRSGEHQTVTMGWGQLATLQQIVDDFTDAGDKRGISDRWAYKLRAELPTLAGDSVPWAAKEAELKRLLNRIEDARGDRKSAFINRVTDLLDQYHEEGKKEKNGKKIRDWSDKQIFEDFVTLCQSASFLARGRDE